MYLYARPGLFEFLSKMKEHFELVLFNNASASFTHALLEEI